jgi:phosphohistidine phosphatase
MELFVIRHAEAAPREAYANDAERPLTPRGRKRFDTVVRALKSLDVRFDRVLHSPWLRAVQTADRLGGLIDGETEVTSLLATNPSLALLEKAVGERVALVGHEPWMGEAVAWLVTGDRTAAERFALDKGGVAWLQGEPAPGKMSVCGILPCAVLRRLG